jgi:uncharacterized protein YciI
MTRSALWLALGVAILAALSAPSSAEDADRGELFAITYRAGPSWKPGVPMEQQGLRDHFYYLRDLHARGTVLLAGPLGDDGGLVLVRARDQAEAERTMATDPAVVSGAFVGDVRPFVPRFASEQPFVAVPPGR